MKTLNDLFDEVRDMDVTDRVCMDKVLEYLEELVEESDNYMQLLVDKLEHATMTWKKPWYQESTCVSTPKKVLIQKQKALSPCSSTFLTGRLSQDECDQIEKNWRKFVKKFDVPDKLECFARWKSRTLNRYNVPEEQARQFVAAYLARRLQRTVPQVYKHIQNYYSRPRKGQYTKDEQKVMDICFHHNPKQATIILTEVLAREPRGIYNKLNFSINGKPEKKRIKWNLSLAAKFVNLLMEHTGESLDGLKNKSIGIHVWRELESDFNTQAEYLRHFWYTTLHCQMFCKRDITLKRIRRKVFKILRKSPYRVWTDIKWKDVAAELPDGLTYQFVYWITVRVFRCDRSHSILPIEELVKIGLQKTNNTKYGNKRLKNLILNEEGNLEVVRYDVKM